MLQLKLLLERSFYIICSVIHSLITSCLFDRRSLDLGVSCFFGLAVTCLFLPMNHYAGKVVVGRLPFSQILLISINIVTGAQENLMKARDERVALMNEASFNRLVCHLISNLWLLDPWWNPYAEGANHPSWSSPLR